jgi:hypothetical protein
MIGKKLILFSILAFSIGMATIVPLGYLISKQAQAAQEQQNQAAKEQQAQADQEQLAQALKEQQNQTAPDQPWFNISVAYAYCNPNMNGGNSTTTFNGAIVEAIANFSLTPEALTKADARIEYYQFQVSSDQGPIVNMTYAIAETKEELNVPGYPNGAYVYITGAGDGTFTFADGFTYNGTNINSGDVAGSAVLFDIPGETNQTSALEPVSDYIYSINGNGIPQAVTALRNAQTLYIDVAREYSVTFTGNATEATAAVVPSNQVLQHLVLTKTGNIFTYGNYTQGILPFQ